MSRLQVCTLYTIHMHGELPTLPQVNGNSAFSFQEPQSSNVKRPPSNPVDITGHCRLSRFVFHEQPQLTPHHPIKANMEVVLQLWEPLSVLLLSSSPLSPSSYPNVLSVTWASNYGQRHCIVVRLVRQLTSQILLDRMKKHVRNIDHSKVRFVRPILLSKTRSEIPQTDIQKRLWAICFSTPPHSGSNQREALMWW